MTRVPWSHKFKKCWLPGCCLGGQEDTSVLRVLIVTGHLAFLRYISFLHSKTTISIENTKFIFSNLMCEALTKRNNSKSPEAGNNIETDTSEEWSLGRKKLWSDWGNRQIRVHRDMCWNRLGRIPDSQPLWRRLSESNHYLVTNGGFFLNSCNCLLSVEVPWSGMAHSN